MGSTRSWMCVSHGFAFHMRHYDGHLEHPPLGTTPNSHPVDPQSVSGTQSASGGFDTLDEGPAKSGASAALTAPMSRSLRG